MPRVSLQTKILVLIISLIFFIIILLTGIISYLEYKETETQIGERALQAAKTFSFMPAVQNAFQLEEPETVIQPLAEKIREEIGAEYIVVGNNESIRYAHPDPAKIGREMVGGDNGQALDAGEYYTSKAEGSLGLSLRGKAPIMDEAGKVVGIVSVGFMMTDIKSMIYWKLLKIGGVSLVILIIGIAGGVLLTRDIRKDTLGLEPYQIASLYRDRNAILASIKEGIIAIDKGGQITMINQSAIKILGLSKDEMQKNIKDIIPDTRMHHVLDSGLPMKDDEVIIRNRQLIINRTPIVENDEVVGVVSSFRDKTEMNEMINTLSEVRRYSEDLRAQTHEYTNKLYALSGLLQLEHYEEAVELIQTESEINKHQNKILHGQIKDGMVQAILLGKLGKASEKKVVLTIDANSSLHPLPKHIDLAKLITIIGNLLDNAFEAVQHKESKEVTFFVTDIGEDIIFDISDNGEGIPETYLEEIFEFNFTTKEKAGHGFGLAIVKETLDELGGQIEVHNKENGGAIFTVFIPKNPI